jgi:zinc/manganese transport system substrate-binding protein
MLVSSSALLLALAAVSPYAPPSDDPPPQGEPVRVVATLTVYADIVRAIGGEAVEVTAIAAPNEDSHFVRPKPSFALQLRRADMFVTTGLDLELWAPALLDRAGNAQVSEGGTGYVTTYTGIELLEVPAAADRSAGDVHVFGNPHLTTDPLRTLRVARNILTGLKRVAPAQADLFDRRMATFEDEMHRRLFGDQLVDALGGQTLADLAINGALMDFLANNELGGRALHTMLGGWLGVAEAFRGKDIICYHKHWAYFQDRFGVRCAEFVESKPGIPPTPRHVARLIDLMRSQGIGVLLAASHFDRDKVETVAQRGGARSVMVPLYSSGTEGASGYFALVDRWVNQLAAAFGEGAE